jgi:general secretion pathway protein F
MSTFRYRGFDATGRARQGFLEALDRKDAREKLAARGVLSESVDPVAGEVGISRGRALFGVAQRATFYRELGALLKAGIPLAAALDLLLETPEQEKQAGRMAWLRDRIREGQTLAAGLAESSPQVSVFERAAIEAGERSGHLDAVLDQLADYLESQARLRESLTSALLYPSLVVVLAFLVAVGLMGFVLPMLSGLFKESGASLPWLTRALLAVSRSLPLWLPAFVLGGVGVGVVARRRWRADAGVQVRGLRALDRWPVYRAGSRTLVSLRFSRTLVLLLRGGVSAVDALALAGQATGNAWVADLIRQQADAVRHGISLSQAIRAVPPLESLTGWVKAGEASGDLTALLDKAADRLQQRWQTYLTRTTSLLEPVLILMVGVFVLLIALAILLPVLSLNQAVL